MASHPISISLRLTVWFGAVLLGGWLLFGATMGFNLRHALRVERMQTLDRRLDRLQDLLQRDLKLDDSARQSVLHDFSSATGNGLIEIFLPTGRPYWQAPSPAAETFPWPSVSPKDPRNSTEQFLQVQANGQPYWTLLRPFQLGGSPVVLVAAAPEAGNLLLLRRFWKSLLASAPPLLLIAMASGYWLSRRALRPVDAITTAARSIGIRNLSERLPVSNSSDELERLAVTCNGMLERLELAVRKLKQFTADASHELRGPLTLTRTVAEVALRNPSIDEESRTAFLEIAEEAARSTALLEQMLELARADAGAVDIVLEPVDVSLILKDLCDGAQTLALQRDIALHVEIGTAVVMGHPPSLRRLFWILLDNAMKYTHAGGCIDVVVKNLNQGVSIQIADTGIGIAPEDIPKIFDRFYRADPSRSETEGSGLGLAIAKWIADLHHASITVESRERIGTKFSLEFPS